MQEATVPATPPESNLCIKKSETINIESKNDKQQARKKESHILGVLTRYRHYYSSNQIHCGSDKFAFSKFGFRQRGFDTTPTLFIESNQTHCDSDKFVTAKFGFRQAGRPPAKISKEFNTFRLTLKTPFVVMSWSAQLVPPRLIRLEDQIRLISLIQLEEYHCCRWPSKVLVDICEDRFCCSSKMWGWVCLEYQIDPFGNSVPEDCFQLDSQRSVLLHTLRGTRRCRKKQESSSSYIIILRLVW
jgi:hypothetical protein